MGILKYTKALFDITAPHTNSSFFHNAPHGFVAIKGLKTLMWLKFRNVASFSHQAKKPVRRQKCRTSVSCSLHTSLVEVYLNKEVARTEKTIIKSFRIQKRTIGGVAAKRCSLYIFICYLAPFQKST